MIITYKYHIQPLRHLLVATALIGLGLVPRTGAAQDTNTSVGRELYLTNDPTRVTCLMPEKLQSGEATGRCYVMECSASGDDCRCPPRLPNGWTQPLSENQCRQLSQHLHTLPPVETSKAAAEEKPKASSLASNAVSTLSPPGDCTREQHRTLQDAVDAACKVPRRCNATQDCTTLLLNYNKNFACTNARDAIDTECFRGGDDGHRTATEDALRAAIRCAELIMAKKCQGAPRR